MTRDEFFYLIRPKRNAFWYLMPPSVEVKKNIYKDLFYQMLGIFSKSIKVESIWYIS